MKVSINFEVPDSKDLEKVNEAIKQIIPEYKINLEFESDEMNQEDEEKK